MAIGITLLAIFVALITAGYIYVQRCMSYWKRRNIPSPPAAFPFGNVHDMILQRASMGEVYTRMYNYFRDSGHKFIGTYTLIEPILMPLDPDLIKNILTKDFDHFVDRGPYVNEKEDPLFAHMFNLSGTRWRNIRVKLSPTFTSGKMKMMFHTLVDCSKGLEHVIEESMNDGIDIKDIVGRFTTDVIGSCAFGLDCNSLKDPNVEFRIYGKKFFNPDILGSIKIFLAFAYPKILALFKARIIEKSISDFFFGVVKDVVQHRESVATQRKDFLNLLLQIRNTGKVQDEDMESINETTNGSGVENGLTIEEIAAQSFLFFIAGFETSSTTLTFCLYELVKNVDVQDKLRQEIEDVLQKHGGEITYEGVIMDMKYMNNVIDETLRKYPPVPILTRNCTKEYYSKEYNLYIPEGQKVFIPVEGLQWDPKYYPEPEKFDPERFNETNCKNRHNYTFLPFGEGPRNCIGKDVS